MFILKLLSTGKRLVFMTPLLTYYQSKQMYTPDSWVGFLRLAIGGRYIIKLDLLKYVIVLINGPGVAGAVL